MRILIAAGGTGGHIYPALAVARSLAERSAELQLRWLGGRRGLEAQLVPAAGLELSRLWLRSLRSTDLSRHTLLDPLRLMASLPQAIWALLRWRPAAVFSTGGYVSVPVLLAAALLRVPSVVWEGNLVPGRSVRFTSRLASAIALSFEEAAARLPARSFVTGTPIRSFAGLDRPAARDRLGLPAELPVLLVFGGSQAVRRLNRALAEALPELLERMSVVHLAGDAGYADALRQREALPAELRPRYRPFAFLRDDMAAALVAADLLVGRAGSSTLAEAAALGLPMVVVPYPWAGGHQSANAERLAAAGAAVIVADADFDVAALRRAAALLDEPAALERMRGAARAFGRPGAGAAVAELVLAAAERAPLPAASVIERLSRGAA
ncbi:MAG TPA: UDP-N-acetylglucosamine--N-acetylmuramyl-(pentapeptide) pyrophosphoryl-undecaprenol N-acetylglucosamine transferase [Candidatus Limnocylindrales bacterium]